MMKQFNHFAHRHSLFLTNPKIQTETQAKTCSCCEIDISLSSQSYVCSKPSCDFCLHIPCFNLPQHVAHNSHPKHPLYLRNDAALSACNACGESPDGFSFCCSKCEFVLHVGCAALPEVEERNDHHHPLTLFYSVPVEFGDKGFDCGVCGENLGKNCWIYGCLLCRIGTHLECV